MPFLFTLLIVAVSCGRAINRAAERRIRDALPDTLGPARQYRVHVDNAPDRTLRGRLANVTIDGDDVQLANGLVVDRLHLDLKGVEVDTERGQLRRIQEARFVAAVGTASLDQYFAGEAPEGETFRKVRLTLEENRVTIQGERVVLGLGVPFQLTGPVRLAGPTRIEIDPTRLTVIGIPLTGVPLRFLKSRFESAIDLSTLPFPIQLTEVRTAEGWLTLTGSADTEALLRRSAERAP
ncbi:MAG TPA: DUF2993 domain-containing protein [Chthonomonadaceae bacterium]|nr:DUF2993 domain-containing protein [Chthonomonadaceae bacterium]